MSSEATLKDKTKSVEERRFALRFFIHSVEDMHMPMHVGDNHDRGGNDTQVRCFDRGTNMHGLWDGGVIERMSRSEDYWLNDHPQEELGIGSARGWRMKRTSI